MGQPLRLPILENLEVLRTEIGDVPSFGIGHDGVQLDQGGGDGEDGSRPLGVRNRCSRLLPESEHHAD
jgi:hypothetical protein